MKILVTGSAGHLGEALVRSLRQSGDEAIGIDITASAYTDVVGSIVDRGLVRHCMTGVAAVLHTATLHKPHVATHSRQDFVDTNISGTLNLLEEASAAGVDAFIFTSTTSTFGDAMTPPADAPAAWIDETVTPIAKNIYGATKLAAEDLCALFHRNQRINCIVLRTSRFFPEQDDRRETREAYADANIKANEFLYRRVDVEDVVSAHLLAVQRASALGFGRYIISATTPFGSDDLAELHRDAPAVLARVIPDYAEVYARLGWKMFPRIDRVYDNARARADLGWQPRYDFAQVLASLRQGLDPRSALAQAIGSKGYHSEVFSDGPYPV